MERENNTNVVPIVTKTERYIEKFLESHHQWTSMPTPSTGFWIIMFNAMIHIFSSGSSSKAVPYEDCRKTTSKHNKQKRPDIQYLRGVAIAAVLGFHLRPKLVPQGFLGVDIFFVISGYLMTLILNFGPKKSFTAKSVLQFYERRMKRLFPAYFMVILATLFVCGFYLISLDFDSLKTDALWAALFSTNLKSMMEKQTYFNLISDYKFLLHTWSLSAEFQYYLLAPFLIYGIYWSGHPLVTTIVVGSASLIFQITMKEFETVSFGCVFSRIWQFLVGSFVFYLEQQQKSTLNPSEDEVQLIDDMVTKNKYSYKSFAELHFQRILIIFSLFTITFMPTLSTAFFYTVLMRITATILAGAAMFIGWSHKPNYFSHMFVYLGDISYSVYLVHWPVITLAKYLQVFESWSVIHNLGIIFFISILQYELFEKKLLKVSSHKVFLICVGIAIGIVVIEIQPQGFGYTSSISQNSAAIENQMIASKCTNYGGPLQCNWDRELLAVMKNRKPKNKYSFLCSYEGTGKATVFFTGNSYAFFQVPTIKNALKDKYKKLYLVSRTACLSFESFNEIHIKRWQCQDIRNKTVKFLEKLKPDILIISQRLSINDNFKEPFTIANAKADQKTLIIADYLKLFSHFVKKIFVIEPHPTLPYNVPMILSQQLSQGKPIDNYYVSIDKLREEVDPGWLRMLAAMETCPKCEPIPIRSIFCKNDKCSIYEKKTNLSLFCDYGHLSTHGVEMMVPTVKTLFNKALDDLGLN